MTDYLRKKFANIIYYISFKGYLPIQLSYHSPESVKQTTYLNVARNNCFELIHKKRCRTSIDLILYQFIKLFCIAFKVKYEITSNAGC